MQDIPGFDRVRGARLDMIVRGDVRDRLEPLLRAWAAGDVPDGRPLIGGRGGVAAFDLSGGLRVVLRPNRRGGFPARFNRDLYFGFSPRPFAELRAIEHLRAHGVPAPEAFAAAARWIAPGCYRAALATREMEGAVNLWEYAKAAPKPAREAACQAAAEIVRRMHDAGVVHPDLNLQNFLVRERDGRDRRGPGGGSPDSPEPVSEVWIIDCDRAVIRPVTLADRRAAVERICRSIRKLDPIAEVLTLACVEAFATIAER